MLSTNFNSSFNWNTTGRRFYLIGQSFAEVKVKKKNKKNSDPRGQHTDKFPFLLELKYHLDQALFN